MAERPTGTVTLLFSDIEGSTRLLHALGDRWASVLAEHRRLFRAAVARHGGHEDSSEGDAFLFVFDRARDALAAAADAQRAFASHAWPDGLPLRVRMGVHTGEPATTDEGYVGIDLHRAARTMAAGHGGQVVVSQATRELVASELPAGTSLADLGEHRLKDLTEAHRLWQLCVDGLPGDFPALRTLTGVAHNLPAQPTPLLGRQRELAELSALLTAGNGRLITLTGAGGTGKTRLALHTAAELADGYPDGVFAVFLAPLADARLLLPTVAQTLALREQPGQTIEQTLRDHLRDRRLLFVLDNMEHLLDAAPDVGRLLAEATGLQVLATSRAPLRLQAESEFPLDTLPAADAAALFVARARAVRPDFAPEAADAVEIDRICARLDGLPLAIELAAARTRTLTPAALLERLNRSLELLTGGARDLPERQRTLRGAIEWSHDLLDADEQAVFRRLGVFAGGWTLDAAEAVGALDGELAVDVLDMLESLVEKSLVRAGREVAGRSRFFMLETIREYAHERLADSGEEEPTRQRHAEHLASLAESLEGELERGSEIAFDRVEAEIANVRAALDWAARRPENGLELRLGAALGDFWLVRLTTEGRERLEAALRADSPDDPALRAKALVAASYLVGNLGEWATAHRYAHEGADLCRSVGDLPRLVLALNMLAGVAASQGERESAEALVGEALHTGREAGTHPLSMATTNAGNVALVLRDYERAVCLSREGARLCEEADDLWGRAIALLNLATAQILTGALSEAHGPTAEALRLSVELDNAHAIAAAVEVLAWLAARSGRTDDAGVLFGAAHGLREEMHYPLPPAEQVIHDEEVERLRAEVGERRFVEQWQRGAAMEREDILALALAEADAGSRDRAVR